jgi:hypothetical protein
MFKIHLLLIGKLFYLELVEKQYMMEQDLWMILKKTYNKGKKAVKSETCQKIVDASKQDKDVMK